MFDETNCFLSARQEIIDHDKPILSRLMEETLPVKDSWELIERIESETIRFYAVREFLQDILGDGTVYINANGRIHFTQGEIIVSFPGPEARERRIYVRLGNIFSPLPQMLRPKPMQPGKKEKQCLEYSKLLKQHAPLRQRIHARLWTHPEWKLLSYVVYFLYTLPSDILCNRMTAVYWENIAADEEKARIEKDNAAITEWMKNISLFKHFFFGMYRVLEQFGFPVYLGDPASGVIVEQIYKIVES